MNDQISPHSGKSKGHDARDRRRESNSQDLHVSGSQPSRRRRRRAKVERTPTPSSSYSDDLASEDPLHPESNSREGKPLEDEAAFHPSKMAPGFKQGIFAKAAVEPPFGSSGSPGVEPLGESAPSKFQKRAESPVLPRDAITPFKPADPVKPIGGGAAKPGEEKEKRLMDDFDLRCLSIYTQFLERNVEMEITEILSHLGGGEDSSEWGAAFASLTRPKRAATGLRYIRLLENYVNWLKRESGDKSQTLDPIGKEVVWHYLHHLAKEEVGAHTPKSFLLALRFLGEALGFCLEAFSYQRNKKLIETHSRALKPKNKAPMIPIKTLEFLECCVEDHTLPVGYRVAAGKLRLCVQASLRWDDLSRTLVGNLEWVRRFGSADIVGLRSKEAMSKTGIRPWVASYLSVTKEGDDWLPVLVRLIMASHGTEWKLHDHLGKSFSSDGKFALTGVATFAQDVSFVRFLLSSALEKGIDLELNEEGVRLLRWHGAKSTLTSVMMHLNEGERAVRFSGNWKDQKESMPDCYLREAQLLVLGAQEKALWFIRDGGVIGKLEGVPLEPGPDHFETDEAATEFREIKTRAKRALEDFKPLVGISRNDVPQAVLDDLVRHGEASTEILASEKGNENFEIGAMAELVVSAEDSLKDVFSPDLEEEVASDSDSVVEFYEEVFVQVKGSLRGSLHKASPNQSCRPRCNVAGSEFEMVRASDPVSKATKFCQRCFGKIPKNGCKLCTKTREVMKDGVQVNVRCGRRCHL